MWYLYSLAILAGVANAVQPGQNATLAKSLGLPIAAGLITLMVSAATLTAFGITTGTLAAPSLDQIAKVPWWAWLGGLFSVVLLFAQLYASPAIGAAAFLGITITAGVVASLVLDNYGWVGFDIHPLNWGRAFGASLMIVGVILVALF